MFKDRTTEPIVGELQEINLLQPQIEYAESGLPIHIMRNLPNDIFHVHIEFGAGKMQQIKPLVSSFTADLLFSGTADLSQLEIQELLDMQGAFVNVESGINHSSLHVYGLLSRFAETFDVVQQVLENPLFPQENFELHRKAALQRHLIGMEKNAYVARREFRKALYANHPIGAVADQEDFENITRTDCLSFFQEHFAQNIEQINVVGDLSVAQLNLLKRIFGKRYLAATDAELLNYASEPCQLYFEKPNALQSTIRIGCVLFTPHHPDYFEFDILETILGGYFGSRLMQNLREEKGYTYGVGSGMTAYEQTGYFFISTEVGKEHKDAALEAIAHEIQRLKDEPVSLEELALARSYIQGQILKSTDGAFAQMSQFLFAKRFNLSQNHLNDFLKTLNQITAERLQQLAVKYLDWEKMVQVVVG